MKLVAISVGKPRDVQWRGRSVETSIFKTPVSGRVHVARGNVEVTSNRICRFTADPEKAVYAYPAEHYDFGVANCRMRNWLGAHSGENFTTEGLLEDEVWIGDRYRVGTSGNSLSRSRACPATSWRIRFGHPDMVKRFPPEPPQRVLSRRGARRRGRCRRCYRAARASERRLTVADVVTLYAADSANQQLLENASDHPSLPAAWREHFRKRLWAPGA